jgi:hypothetical protein
MPDAYRRHEHVYHSAFASTEHPFQEAAASNGESTAVPG